MASCESDRDRVHLDRLDLIGHRIQNSTEDLGRQLWFDGGFEETGVGGCGIAQQFSQKQAPGHLELTGAAVRVTSTSFVKVGGTRIMLRSVRQAASEVITHTTSKPRMMRRLKRFSVS